ncbi:MAG: DNA polymerase III subunit gamma/tau, partial [Clostridia bacterium]|nr:DNA polymerase III subunit gamma/tau [Clostridia bacterium]
PTTFDGLIGQDHIVRTLVNQIKSDKLGHAYLFTGTRGTGKTSAAKIFAKAINCLSPVNGSPCGKCQACVALSDASNIDVIEIDAASNNGVNEIRDLREKVQYPPVSCKYKVYIVDEVHMLTGAAFNALLKTLEEPPKHAVFILATTEVHKIPATILSRCMRFDFRLISTEQIASLISNIYDEQGKKYEKEAIIALAKAGEGSIRDALSIADIALSYSDKTLTYDDVMDVLGASNREMLSAFISGVLSCDTATTLKTIENLASLGKSMGVLSKDVIATVRDLLVVKTCDNANDILGLPMARFNEYKAIANNVSEERLLRVLEIFSDAENSLKYSVHPRVTFETATIKATRPEIDYNIDALMSRIKDLEEKVKSGVTVVKEEVSAPVEIKKEPDIKKSAIYSVPLTEIKGRLLVNIRNLGSELLWNVLQNVEMNVNGNVLSLITSNGGDKDLLENSSNREKIMIALDEYLPFELQVNISEKEKNLSEVDKATERIKSIFGDVVIIND